MALSSLKSRKSPLAWVGGKSKLTSTIIPLIPPHQCYVEGFAGAAWVLFRKSESKVEVINDINGDLVCLYRVLQNHLEEFMRYFKWSLVSREEFNRLQNLPAESLTDIQRAARFYYLVKTAFGAKASGQTFGVARTAKPRLNLLRLEEDLSEAHLRLSRVFIENMSYRQLIPRFDSKDTFYYLDPPYWDTENVYGPDLFSKDDFTTLRDLVAAAKGKWMISINDVQIIRELFDGYNVKEVSTSYSINSEFQKPVTELLITNYKLP